MQGRVLPTGAHMPDKCDRITSGQLLGYQVHAVMMSPACEAVRHPYAVRWHADHVS